MSVHRTLEPHDLHAEASRLPIPLQSEQQPQYTPSSAAQVPAFKPDYPGASESVPVEYLRDDKYSSGKEVVAGCNQDHGLHRGVPPSQYSRSLIDAAMGPPPGVASPLSASSSASAGARSRAEEEERAMMRAMQRHHASQRQLEKEKREHVLRQVTKSFGSAVYGLLPHDNGGGRRHHSHWDSSGGNSSSGSSGAGSGGGSSSGSSGGC